MLSGIVVNKVSREPSDHSGLARSLPFSRPATWDGRAAAGVRSAPFGMT